MGQEHNEDGCSQMYFAPGLKKRKEEAAQNQDSTLHRALHGFLSDPAFKIVMSSKILQFYTYFSQCGKRNKSISVTSLSLQI